MVFGAGRALLVSKVLKRRARVVRQGIGGALVHSTTGISVLLVRRNKATFPVT